MEDLPRKVTEFIHPQTRLRFCQIQLLSLQKFLFLLEMLPVRNLQRYSISEQQIWILKEQGDFLTRKLYGTKTEKTSTLEIEGEMSLFNEIEFCADPKI